MTQITATYAKNNLGAVWELAKNEPVEVRSNGAPIAVILSPEEYTRLVQRRGRLGRPRRFGLLAHRFQGFDTDALLRVDVSDAFRDALP